MTHTAREAQAEYRIAQDGWPQFSPTGLPVTAWHYYAYEHLDRLEFMRPARAEIPHDDVDATLRGVSEAFRAIGWEGDGAIEVFWLPPFIAGLGDTAGFLVFHVKQQNNGTSFLASPHPLPGLGKLADRMSVS